MDPISNMLNGIKNAGAAHLPTVTVPYSNHSFSIAELLEREGYIASVVKKGKKVRKFIEIGIRYDNESKPRVSGVKRLSKPSRRVYMDVSSIRPVRQGHGTLVLSTPKGIMTDMNARKEHVGGEALFTIW